MIYSPLFFVATGLGIVYFLMVLFFFVGWLRLNGKTWRVEKAVAQEMENAPFVSIVIPVRNESENIQACLNDIFAQNYPSGSFEVIVIDDYSTDPTLRLARECARENMLILDLQQYLGDPGEYLPNKKKAIALGIKNAQGELIITTDGDCQMGENWLNTMVQYYNTHDFKLLTGPVMIKPARGPLAWFQQLDLMNMVAITGATIRNGSPIMCNGANLMYSKKIFHEVEGFKGNHEIPTGDDIFLMNKINSRYPGSIGFVKDFDACVFTRAEKSLPGFLGQRIRWVSKSRHTGGFTVMPTLVFAYVYNLFILILAGLWASQPWQPFWQPLAVAGGVKLLADFIFDVPVTWFFKKPVSLLILPFIEIGHILYVVLAGPLSLLGRYRWKGRLVK